MEGDYQMLTTYMTKAMVLASSVNMNLSTDQLIGSIVDFICNVAMYIGIVIVVTGIFSIVLAYKDDNAEGQSRAIRLAVVGGVLVGLKPLLKVIGIIS